MALPGSESKADGKHMGADETQPLLGPQPVLQDGRLRVMTKSFTRSQHWKNLIVLSLTFLFCFTAYGAIQSIQSSLNANEGLGLLSLGCIYLSLMFSSLVAPTIIRFIGVKWTIVFATLCYCIYSYANLFQEAAVLLPASVLLGLSGAPLWVAQGTYLTTSAIQLAALVNEVPEFVISRFNGVLFAFFQTNQIWGNMISYFVLDAGSSGDEPLDVTNCGSESCGAVVASDAAPPDSSSINLLFTLFSASGMIAVLLAMCLDPLPSGTAHLETESGSGSTLLMSTVKLMGKFQLFLLIPLFMYSGVEQAFIFGDFTKSFVTCTQGVSMVGLVMIAFGISDTLFSLIIGQLEKFTGRILLFTAGSLIQLGLLVFLYVWDPAHIEVLYLYLVAIGWGIGDAIFQTQCASIIGVIFAGCQEPAFSNYRLWQAAGFVISFVTTIPGGICVWHKIIGVSTLLVVSMAMYYISIIGVIFADCQEPAFSNYQLWQSAGFVISFVTTIPGGICVWHKIIGVSSLQVVSMAMYYICEYKIRRETREVLLN